MTGCTDCLIPSTSITSLFCARCNWFLTMPLYHFDAQDEKGSLATESQSLADHDAARGHAARLAVRLVSQAALLSSGEGIVVVEAYTAEDGVVLTVRLVLNVEMA